MAEEIAEFANNTLKVAKYELHLFSQHPDEKRTVNCYVFSCQSIRQLEEELLGGQKLQGPATADEVHGMLKAKDLLEKFPLFTAVHRICTEQIRPADLIDQIRNHPEHVLV